MFCKWACTVLMYLDFGSIPHKVNMAAKTIVSLRTSCERSNVEGLLGGCQVSTVCGNSHYTFKWELPCVMYQPFYSCTCRFPPETIHWSWKLSPSIFICQPVSTTQVGSTFVFLDVTMSPGSHVPPVLFLGRKWLQGSGKGGSFLSVRVWWHISLQLQLSLHCEEARNFTAKMIDEWLTAENSKGGFLEK